MSNQYNGEIRDTIIEMASRPGGVSTEELAKKFNKSVTWAGSNVSKLLPSKSVIVGKLSHRKCRYFTRQEDAERWVMNQRIPVSKAKGTSWKPTSATPSTPPAHQEGEPIIPKGVKIQRCPNYQPRNQVVELLTNKPPITRRSGEEFLSIKSRGF